MIVIKRSKIFEQVADVLERRIHEQSLSAGAELPSERDLMKEFGVGRPAVREALFHLQRMGLVEMRPGARAQVAVPSVRGVMHSVAGSARYLLSASEGIKHFQDARILFETGLVRDAARLASDADIARLKTALDNNRESIGDTRRFEQSDVAFHFAIATVPNNPIYTALHSAIIEWLVDQRHVTLSYPGQNKLAYQAHVAIYEAIAARDPDAAAAEMRAHLEQVATLYWKVSEAKK
jgi:GntR family transcriptional regulator, sialic acid-inducible nan operon repressor